MRHGLILNLISAISPSFEAHANDEPFSQNVPVFTCPPPAMCRQESCHSYHYTVYNVLGYHETSHDNNQVLALLGLDPGT